MKRWSVVMLALAVVLAVGSLAFAAAPAYPAKKTPAAQVVLVDGKVLAMGKGWVQLQVGKVLKGKGLHLGQKIRFREASKVIVMEKGKTAALSALKPGETVEISATVSTSGKTTVYTATRITITP